MLLLIFRNYFEQHCFMYICFASVLWVSHKWPHKQMRHRTVHFLLQVLPWERHPMRPQGKCPLYFGLSSLREHLRSSSGQNGPCIHMHKAVLVALPLFLPQVVNNPEPLSVSPKGVCHPFRCLLHPHPGCHGMASWLRTLPLMFRSQSE